MPSDPCRSTDSANAKTVPRGWARDSSSHWGRRDATAPTTTMETRQSPSSAPTPIKSGPALPIQRARDSRVPPWSIDERLGVFLSFHCCTCSSSEGLPPDYWLLVLISRIPLRHSLGTPLLRYTIGHEESSQAAGDRTLLSYDIPRSTIVSYRRSLCPILDQQLVCWLRDIARE